MSRPPMTSIVCQLSLAITLEKIAPAVSRAAWQSRPAAGGFPIYRRWQLSPPPATRDRGLRRADSCLRRQQREIVVFAEQMIDARRRPVVPVFLTFNKSKCMQVVLGALPPGVQRFHAAGDAGGSGSGFHFPAHPLQRGGEIGNGDFFQRQLFACGQLLLQPVVDFAHGRRKRCFRAPALLAQPLVRSWKRRPGADCLKGRGHYAGITDRRECPRRPAQLPVMLLKPTRPDQFTRQPEP